MSRTGSRIIQRLAIVLIMVTFTLLADSIRNSEAHQDPCHRLHSSPSDHQTYVCGDKALADQYIQNWQAHRQHSQPYVGRAVR